MPAGKLNNVQRTLILLDLLKDGQVSDTDLYAGLDKMEAPLAISIVQALWDVRGKQAFDTDEDGNQTPREPNNGELASHFINLLRSFVQELRRADRVQKAVATTRESVIATADADNVEDLGEEE